MLSGIHGRVDWGFRQAAAITRYSVTRDPKGWRLSATLDRPDAFALSQRPLKFVAIHARGEWRWPIVELSITDATLSAVLGPQEPTTV
jgi:hypothetical protein